MMLVNGYYPIHSVIEDPRRHAKCWEMLNAFKFQTQFLKKIKKIAIIYKMKY